VSTTTKEALEMTTTTIAAPAPTTPRSRISRRLALGLAGIVLALLCTSIGTWLALDQAGGTADATASASAPVFETWLRPINVVGLQKQLVRAGYSIAVNGVLEPITKSALADFLQPSSRHPLGPSLAVALQGTVITTLRDPRAWNMRFGLNRRTRFVERPLVGPDGQLDAYGNVRDHR
jgi:hypothetical protein